MSKSVDVKQETAAILDRLGVPRAAWTGGSMASFSPVTGEEIARLKPVSSAEAAAAIEAAHLIEARGFLFRHLIAKGFLSNAEISGDDGSPA